MDSSSGRILSWLWPASQTLPIWWIPSFVAFELWIPYASSATRSLQVAVWGALLLRHVRQASMWEKTLLTWVNENKRLRDHKNECFIAKEEIAVMFGQIRGWTVERWHAHKWGVANPRAKGDIAARGRYHTREWKVTNPRVKGDKPKSEKWHSHE